MSRRGIQDLAEGLALCATALENSLCQFHHQVPGALRQSPKEPLFPWGPSPPPSLGVQLHVAAGGILVTLSQVNPTCQTPWLRQITRPERHHVQLLQLCRDLALRLRPRALTRSPHKTMCGSLQTAVLEGSSAGLSAAVVTEAIESHWPPQKSQATRNQALRQALRLPATRQSDQARGMAFAPR